MSQVLSTAIYQKNNLPVKSSSFFNSTQTGPPLQRAIFGSPSPRTSSGSFISPHLLSQVQWWWASCIIANYSPPPRCRLRARVSIRSYMEYVSHVRGSSTHTALLNKVKSKVIRIINSPPFIKSSVSPSRSDRSHRLLPSNVFIMNTLHPWAFMLRVFLSALPYISAT